jgi:stearoyl-CoA desaturase (delta-9 desaturase)
VLARASSRLLLRHPKLLYEPARQTLRELLGRDEVLRTVIEFRDRLHQIWDETSASSHRALEQLRELCVQAEGSRVLALKRFALRLRTYVPATRSASVR